MERYISPKPDFPESLRQILAQHTVVVVSGQPLNIYTADGKEFFHNDCGFVIDLPIFVTHAVMGRIPQTGHEHVHSKFYGMYPMISGMDSDLNEYRFGAKPELGFEVHPYATAR